MSLRAPLLATLLLAVLGGAPGWAQTEDQPPGTKPPQPMPRAGTLQLPKIEKPQDPSRVKGTFVLNGQPMSITDGDFYETYLVLKPHDEQPNRPLAANAVLNHHLLYLEAKALGFAPSQEEINQLNPAKRNPAMAASFRQRWELQGITEAQYEEYLRQKQAVTRMKDFFASASVVTSDHIFDTWKRDHLLHVIGYIPFSADEVEAELRKRTPTEEQLKTFWQTSPVAQNQFRIPTSVSGDLVIFDPASLNADEVARLRQDRPISREEALKRFNQDRERFIAMVPTDKRPLLHPIKKPDIFDIVTPFELVRERVEEEILLGDRISAAFEAVQGLENPPSEQIAEIAKSHGLRHEHVTQLTRENSASQFSDLGQALFTNMFNTSIGKMSEEVHYEGAYKYFWHISDKTVAAVPPFEAVKGKLSDIYYQETSFKQAWEAARKVAKKVEERVSLVVAKEEQEIDANAQQRANADIAQRGTTDSREKANIQNQHRMTAQNEKRMLRSRRAPQYFDEIVQEMGLETKRYGPFNFKFQHTDRSNLPKEEAMAAFFRSNFSIKSLEPGAVTLAPLSDTETRTHFLVKLLERTEPTFEHMDMIDYHRLKVIQERQSTFQTNYQWNPFEVIKRLQWKAK